MMKGRYTTHVLVSLVCFFAISFTSIAQPSTKTSFKNFKMYTSKEGLYSEKIQNIIQDSLGFLWLATIDGLYQYDGNTFTSFEHLKHQSELLSLNILCMYKDKHNDLWIGTSKGLLFYNHIKGSFKTISLLGIKEYVLSILQDEHGRIWVSTYHGVYIVNPSHQVTHVSSTKNIHDPLLLASPLIKNKVFLVVQNKILSLDNKTGNITDSLIYSNNTISPDNVPMSALIDHNKQFWIGKYNGELIRLSYSDNRLEQYDLKTLLQNPSAKVNSFFKKDNERLWMTVDESGIIYYNYNTQRFEEFETTKQNHLPSYKVNTFFIDSENNYWTGIEKNGLSMTNSYINNFNYLSNDVFGKNTIVSSIIKDKKNNVWVGTDGSGIYVFNTSQVLSEHYMQRGSVSSGLSNNKILALLEDSKSRIWIGSYKGGLSLFNPASKTFKHYQKKENDTSGLLLNDIRKIVEDKDGNLWLAVHGKGVSCFNPNTETFKNYTQRIGFWTNDIFVSADGAIWVATSTGLFRKEYKQQDFSSVYLNDKTIPETFVNCIYQDYNKHMWFGTLHGVYFYNETEKQFEKITASSVLSNAAIKSIIQDRHGLFFIATNSGLFRYNPSTNVIDIFGVKDGLQSENFIINSSYKSDETLYLGTNNGFVWFNTTALSIVKTTIPIYLTDVRIFNTSMQHNTHYSLDKSIIYMKELAVSHDDNYISFCFAFPSYITGSSNLNFEYMLKGFDKNWQQGNRQMMATYTSIPPGNYELHVRLIKNNFYKLSQNELVFKLTVHPPFYATWWFRLLAFVSITLLIMYYFRLKKRQWIRANQLLELKIAERTKEIQEQNKQLEAQRTELEQTNKTKDKLFSIIAHDLRSPFTAILSMSAYLTEHLSLNSSVKVKEITQGISKASKNAYDVLENLLQWAQSQTGRLVYRPSWVPINQTIHSIIEASSLQAMDKNIVVDFKSTQLLEAEVDRSMFETIVRNLLHNAIKYSHQDGLIEVQLETTSNGFNFVIKDNGVGMSDETINQILKREVLISHQGTMGEVGTGIGLSVVREFVQLHRAHWTITSEKGTTITILFNCLVQERENTIEDQINKLTDEQQGHSSFNVLDEKTLAFLKDKQVLVVDDQDEIRQAVILQLEGKVLLHQAANGIEALVITKEVMPDLIISDVVMPAMNGIEFSSRVKNDILTSHIPVILLTSQKEESDVIVGLQSGVDDYLLKPCIASILLLKIANLLLNRERVKKKFSLNDAVLLDSLKDNSLDKKFIQKILDFIDTHIDNEELNVELLSSEVGMHRTNLTKKLSALTGTTPNDLIKSQRMKLAAKLLLTSGKNISEVAYDVGFSDPKYFSKVFKTHFGVLPSEYLSVNE